MKQPLPTYYQLLGIETNASTEEILKAFKEKAKIHHPDVNNGSATATEMFTYIKSAKECLTNPTERLQYDYLIGVKVKPAPRQFLKPMSSANKKNNFGIGEIVGIGLLALLAGIAIGGSRKK